MGRGKRFIRRGNGEKGEGNERVRKRKVKHALKVHGEGRVFVESCLRERGHAEETGPSTGVRKVVIEDSRERDGNLKGKTVAEETGPVTRVRKEGTGSAKERDGCPVKGRVEGAYTTERGVVTQGEMRGTVSGESLSSRRKITEKWRRRGRGSDNEQTQMDSIRKL